MGWFAYADEVLAAYPGIRGGVIHLKGATNGASPTALQDEYTEAQEHVVAQLGSTPLSEIASIAAWRKTFTAFGVKPTQYRNAAEALLRRLTKQGDIPSINTLVDMANLVSISEHVPVAVFDQRDVSGGTTIRHADGTEQFTDLGGSQSVAPTEGEVVFVDEALVVSARRWCWRQSAQSAARTDTSEALITIEGLHEEALEDVPRALNQMLDLIERYQPGATAQSAILGPDKPELRFD